jgi:DnaK suppressor protein
MELNKYKKLLFERREKFEEMLEGLKSSSKPVDLQEPIGRLSRMDAMQQQQMALNSRIKAELSLKQIEQAFKRIEKGDYGICLSCEDEIPHNRLNAVPESPFCTQCSNG